MLDWLFPLPIFPENSLASSVTTTVWVGVWVVAFFNLRFGWVLSGLVVPGYIVPLMIAQPWAAVVILVEAATTYLIVWLISERLSGAGTWSGLFGRDRFLALLLVSILVRLSFDTVLLPKLAQVLSDRLAVAFDWSGNFHSFGLIVIALLANQFWKPGLFRGMVNTLVMLGVTWAFVRYGLMEMTNFRISGVAYLYESLASSILASPKAYIILVTTAVLASRMNLLYGWDFNGILIPALIALQWYEPTKILTSFLEAFLIYSLSVWALRLPVFANVNMEGARKMLLFFNVGFAWKLLLGHGVAWAGLDLKITDLFGFGYLLSTLLAVKMHDKNIMVRLTRTTLQISVLGAFLGNLAGLALLGFTPSTVALSRFDAKPSAPGVSAAGLSVGQYMMSAVVALYGNWRGDSYVPPTNAEVVAFREGVRRFLTSMDDPDVVAGAMRMLAAAGYRVDQLAPGIYALTGPPDRGWGAYVVDLASESQLVVSVPDGASDAGAGVAAAALFELIGARALALAGVSPSLTGDQRTDASRAYPTIYQAFHEAVSGGVLEIRAGEGGGAAPARLDVGLRFPEGLDTVELEQALGPVDVSWAAFKSQSIQSNAAPLGFASLRLGPEQIRRIVGTDALETVSGAGRLEGYIRGLVLPANRAAGAPTVAELLYFDREVLQPLMRIAADAAAAALGPEVRAALSAVDVSARAVGYHVSAHRNEPTGLAYAVLSPITHAWGVYAVRLGGGAPTIVQIPRPTTEPRSFAFGLSLAASLDAGILLVDDDRAQYAGNAGTASSLFDLVSQVALRDARVPPLAIQTRAFAIREGAAAPRQEILIATDRTYLGAEGNTAIRELVDRLSALGFDAALVEGQAETVGYEFGLLRQSRYLPEVSGADFAVLWVSPVLSGAYEDHEEADSETALFTALGIPTTVVSPLDYIAQTPAAAASDLPPEVFETIAAYQSRRDSVAIAKIATETSALRYERIFDPDSRQAYLAVLGPDGSLVALASLATRHPERIVAVDPAGPDPGLVARFIDTRAGWLTSGAVR